MKTTYSSDLKAHLSVDEEKRVRHILHTHILHTQEYFLSEKNNARIAAADYLQRMADTFQIPPAQLRNLNQAVSFLDPRERDIEYRLYEVKKFFAAATSCYYQTIDNVPVWRAGITVSVKANPYRIVHADNYGHDDLALKMPPRDVIEKVRAALIKINSTARHAQLVHTESEDLVQPAIVSFKNVFAASRGVTRRAAATTTSWFDRIRITRGLFYVYRYDAENRQPKNAVVLSSDLKKDSKSNVDGPEARELELTLPLPQVPAQIKNGQHYLVVEIVFQLGGQAKNPLNWKALVEVETGSILWLRAMTSGQVHGLVFTYDPKTSTGVLANTPDSDNTVLDPLRDDVELLNLNAPAGMDPQSLSGTNLTIADDDAPAVAAPTQPVGTDFDFAARTNNFAAVNAYYHANNVFDVIEDLGFSLTGPGSYFEGTTFPVHVDHRASFQTADGIEVNAFCFGDAGGGAGDGIGLVGYCLSDDTGVDDTTVNPLGRSVDKWVHWHEIGGHGILYDHVSSPNFGFAHSAGDTLAAFQNDPESQLRALPERFQYAPFRFWPAGADRWFNRTVAAGWGWGGAQDTGGYKTEQIIATTLFRVYQSLGGDANEVNKRWHASRVGTYLVLNAVGHCSPMDNPGSALAFYNKLILADTDDWTSEGLAGGAYNKVIRWSFEKQDLWSGDPPTVDLYIDDGRGGEYPYQPEFWNNQSLWNRQSADGMTGHENAVEGASNYAYVKVKNRGTTDAEGVVKVYHCTPGSGLIWPTDFVQMDPIAGLPTGNLLANNGNEVTLGPFTWTPNANVYGHDCLLAIVTADGDPSNVSNLEPGQTIPEWRLVPHDNNIGQRNVHIVPGGGGSEALMAGLNGALFFAGNNFNKLANMELQVGLPRVLAAKGWRLQFANLASNNFQLKPGEKRKIELKLLKGADFTADEIRAVADSNFSVYLYGNGMLVGGMTYRVDPDLTKPSGGKRQPGFECQTAADKLLECLNVSRGQKVKKVCIKKVSLDIELDHNCGCD